jgi:hypothetical protein
MSIISEMTDNEVEPSKRLAMLRPFLTRYEFMSTMCLTLRSQALCLHSFLSILLWSAGFRRIVGAIENANKQTWSDTKALKLTDMIPPQNRLGPGGVLGRVRGRVLVDRNFFFAHT